MNKEYRKSQQSLVVREEQEGSIEGNTLTGYICHFSIPSEILYDPKIGDFVEYIDPHAFDRTLRDHPDVRALYNHNTDHVLGRTKSGTLALVVDETGLHCDVDLPDTTAARDLKASVRRGDIDGCSFGFVVMDDEVELVEGGPAKRTLLDVDLFEVSTGVAFPAYEGPTISLRTIERAKARQTKRHWAENARRRLQIEDL